MASPSPSGQSEQTADPDFQTDDYASSNSDPPSPSDISAAAILTTLSESRPPTNHSEDTLHFFDDDDSGGIPLIEEGEGVVPPTSSEELSLIEEAIHMSINLGHLEMEILSSHSLDQNVEAFEALTEEQLPSPHSYPALAVADLIVPPPSVSMSAQEIIPTFFDDHLSIQDVTAFVDITSFFKLYGTPAKTASASSLELVEQAPFITRDDLDGERCDYQGIDWSERSSRSSIRTKRAAFEIMRLQQQSPLPRLHHSRSVPDCDNFFSFRRMNARHKASYPHFQLRNLMSATSRNDIYYANKYAIYRTDADGSPAATVVDISKRTVSGNACQITTLAAQRDVLVAGGFEGEYSIVNLSSTFGSPDTPGTIKDWCPNSRSYITNHVGLFDSRFTYTPQAVLCSNDARLRVLDCATNTFTHTFSYPSAVNCSAMSPDGRLRVVVGDFKETLITNADTGQPLQTLNAHIDDGFACAWADDGIHIATAAQDSSIIIWDARSWKLPVAVVSSEVSIPRVLRFSPVGSGPRVLVAAEADDYISIFNAQTFESKQTFDFFGPTAGLSMTPDGQSLFIANAESRFGGIIELERAGWGEHIRSQSELGNPFWSKDDDVTDWVPDGELETDLRVPCGVPERNRRGLELGDIVV